MSASLSENIDLLLLQPESRSRNYVSKVEVEGGGVQHIAGLKTMSLEDPDKNWEMFSNWADSVRSFPQVTEKKVRGKARCGMSKVTLNLKGGYCVKDLAPSGGETTDCMNFEARLGKLDL